MATLTDRLDYVLGANSADRLDEVFGMRTVDDLLRHYPRSYTVGATVRSAEEEGAEQPETGQHITIVDTITSAATIATKKDPKKKIFRITVGSGRSAVTATFFNARFISKDLIKGTRVMLSGEVGFYKNSHAADAPGVSHPRRKKSRLQQPEKHRQGLRGHQGRRAGDRGLRAQLLSDLSGQLPRCRAGTSSPACARRWMSLIRWTIRCRRNWLLRMALSPKTKHCAPSISPRTSSYADAPASG